MWMTLLGLVPGLLGIIERWQKTKTDAQVAITTAKIGGDTDKARELVKAAAVNEHEQNSKLAIVAGNRILTWLVVAFAAPLAFYFGKVMVYDLSLGLGSTPALKDPQIIEWSKTIVYFIFGAPTAVAIINRLTGR